MVGVTPHPCHKLQVRDKAVYARCTARSDGVRLFADLRKDVCFTSEGRVLECGIWWWIRWSIRYCSCDPAGRRRRTGAMNIAILKIQACHLCRPFANTIRGTCTAEAFFPLQGTGATSSSSHLSPRSNSLTLMERAAMPSAGGATLAAADAGAGANLEAAQLVAATYRCM